MNFEKVMGLWKTMKTYPFGKSLFSYMFSLNAPYFLSIRPLVQDVAPGVAVVSMKQRWYVQNHIKTVHAIAVCNLVEMAMGLVAEASIPKHLRWLPMGMDVNYVKKATGNFEMAKLIDKEDFSELH